MASGKGTTLGNAVLNAVLRNTSLAHATVYLALFTDDGSVLPTTEVTGTSYARAALSSTNFGSVASSGSISNTVAIDFAESGGAWATGSNIRSFAIMDALSTGNVLYWGAFNTPYQAITAANQVFRIAIGGLTIYET